MIYEDRDRRVEKHVPVRTHISVQYISLYIEHYRNIMFCCKCSKAAIGHKSTTSCIWSSVPMHNVTWPFTLEYHDTNHDVSLHRDKCVLQLFDSYLFSLRSSIIINITTNWIIWYSLALAKVSQSIKGKVYPGYLFALVQLTVA